MEIIEDSEFPERGTYNWEKMTDGKQRRAVSGVDFKCQRESFIAGLYDRARRKGFDVRVHRVGFLAVEFQFSKKV